MAYQWVCKSCIGDYRKYCEKTIGNIVGWPCYVCGQMSNDKSLINPEAVAELIDRKRLFKIGDDDIKRLAKAIVTDPDFGRAVKIAIAEYFLDRRDK